LLAVSAQSTAGFAPTDVGRLDDATKLILIGAMFVGGGLGSTAGGVKVLRFVVVLRAAGLAIMGARLLTHAVVKLQVSGRNVDELSEEPDCGFLHGDGTRPRLLREAGPDDTDVLLCLSKNDQDNVLASLVGRSLGYAEVVTKISDTELEYVCAELRLHNTVNADQVTARRLVDLVEGRGVVELSTVLRGDARFFVMPVTEDEAGPLSELKLPAGTHVLYGYHEDALFMPEDDTRLRAGDDLVLLTNSEQLKEWKDS
jgi:trk system potassium uptake protein TrkA